MTTMTIPGPSHPDQSLMPPHNADIERATLGAMMLSAEAYADVTEVLNPKDAAKNFYEPAHVAIFNAIVAVNDSIALSGDFADVMRVAAELNDRHELRRIGDAPYLHTCLQSAVSPINARHYAEKVAEKAQLRQLVAAGMRITQLGYDGASIDDHSADPDRVARVVDRAQQLLYDATANPRAESSLVTADAAALEVLDQMDNPTARDLVMSGLIDLDNLIGGLQPGEFTVVAGRPGHGKTLLALSYVRETAIKQRKPTLFFSLEMSRTLLMQRILAAEAGTLLDYITGKQPCPSNSRQLLQLAHQDRIAPAPLHIDDGAYQTTATIRSAIRRFAQRHGGVPALVVVDYLGLLSSTRSFERRDLEIAAMTRDFKIMAGEFGTTIIVVHQLNRNSTQRADPHPQLADLRDGGSIEQDAFEVIWVYSPGVDDPTNHTGESTLGVPKNRQGVTGRVQVAWQAGMGRLGNLAP